MTAHYSAFRYLVVLLSGWMLAGSCAKENLPEDLRELQSYNKLYLVQSSLTGNINYRLYVNSLKTDTSFSIYNVTIGGNSIAGADIPVSFEALGQDMVDAYNQEKHTAYQLLPAQSYTLVEDTVIKKGNSSTGILPIKIKLPLLEKNIQYLLPVRFTTDTRDYEVDEQKQVAYFIFKATVEPTGKIIGNIPLIDDPRTRVLDFFEDIMVRDTAGDLWVYPLKGRESLGDPVKVGSGFSDVISLIFEPYYAKLIGILSSGSFKNHIASWTVTEFPDVKIGATWLVFKTSDYATPGFRESFWSGPHGRWYGIWTNDALYYFSGLNASGALISRTSIGTGFKPATYSSNTIIGKDLVSNNINGLLLYSMNDAGSGFPANRWMIGDGFFSYLRLFSVGHKDLIAVKKNGDLVRYKDFDIYGFYHAL
ncbi:DUF1735 domain-containing protein [Niabella aurantiaca]|uniref:DUF1735 domain-containing protein n=1 Tax=Niabella aurantiaca TaxID=379900 RepID=UPI000372FD0D|nr:DUF1735 domain-containing protein [Niabella aurantiaca]